MEARARDYDRKADQILDATGVKGGLIVHLGCGDGKLTTALGGDKSYLVQGLDIDREKVQQARRHIRSIKEYGKVSVEEFDGKRLPYADNLANLIVAEDLGGVAKTEAMRVLVPGGVLYVKQEGRWVKTIKPRPKNTDEWTHFLHDASGNAVAHDEVVGPPRYIQWIAEPRHTRSHEHTPSINALVSAGGRIFYIADEALIGSLRQIPKWHLIARDAYNGILLWKRPFSPWFPHIVNWGAVPSHLQRRLVAVGDRIYVTLGLHAPLSAVDGATGEIVKVYEKTRGTEEVVCHKGVLLLAIRSITEERTAELDEWAKLAKEKHSPLYARETAQPLVNRFRSIENKAEKTILALDAGTGRVLWKKTGKEVAGLRPVSLCAIGDRVFYQKGKDVICLNLKTGRQHWSASSAPLRVVCEDCVVCAGGRTVTALSVETGKSLWSREGLLTDIRDAFVVNGSLWLGGFKPIKGKRGPSWGPYFVTQRELATGKVLRHVEPENPGHHHRCWRNKATERYILGGRRGVEYIDLKTGDVLWHSWVRGVCKYGVMPCNGLLYAPPHACGCYIAAKLTGFYALASENNSKMPADNPAEEHLERGTVYSENNQIQQSEIPAQDWPTYRHDAQRSGSTQYAVPGALRRKWQADVGVKITSPTVAGGKVFVASVDEHRVCAIDADSGLAIWDFTAGARVDSPPTLYADSAIFGCRDGYVYSLRASDGELAWRLRTWRNERLITASGQLESASPIHGSVLVRDGEAYFTVGRSSYLDGGIELYRLEAPTGKTLSKTRFYSPDPVTGKQPKQFGPAYMPGALGEILSSDEQYVYLRDMVLNKLGERQPNGNRHLFTLTGFLDDSWPHRSYWIFGKKCSLSTGCSGRDRNLISGRLLVFDKPMIYGYGRAKVHWSNQFQDGAYRLFALNSGDGKEQWTKRVPIQVRAMVLADKVLFAAGPLYDSDSGSRGSNEHQDALLIAFSASDGSELAKYQLDSSPIFDGMAAADGRLYLSLENGHVFCMAGR
ncbi:MAG: PQQ-binding-like beta-propeller repeat protein [Phycisphaerae bacterium]|nr:PQQ-binding-like beta-propeller repeat protein [Phycisphaerae bacterium]NIP53458.1 PQQ-binding-like beta-propeller repeat protein [Phycisphaerae bacterium]NIS52419.1 PQQ-binding-like beta-propeller repeat protein [Phycisphaerae bacterium]NIU09951.1 PQQ-binding-like beta-propeller repeat protein [Phycisphaerae bacterium]NIU60203.1 PQQ-binding-like beta-propeller repeat protein [Phycisphaerae bacterium]